MHALVLFALLACGAPGGDPARGLELLLGEPFQGFALYEAEFDRLWTVWPEPQRAAAAAAEPAARRALALSRYGLVTGPGRARDVPLAFAERPDQPGRWSLNCLFCHAGKVEGRYVPGLGNSHVAFRTLMDDLVALRRADGQDVDEFAFHVSFLKLGESDGTTNAQGFSAVLTAQRDLDLEHRATLFPPVVPACDLDAPPLWHARRKARLYIDGTVEKSPRVIMQFALARENSGEVLRGWEDEFEHVLAWIESLTPPRWPGAVDAALAARGRTVFEATCADCHGTYGEGGRYPEKLVPIEEVGTDELRLEQLPARHRRFLRESWLGGYGQNDVDEDPAGYVAPPLDGIWASAPYLHNGSVPTLWHLLHPAERPLVWRRSEDGYDRARVGLELEETGVRLPESARDVPEERRRWFDARLPGKGAGGHDYPDALSEDERRALLEYLKTL